MVELLGIAAAGWGAVMALSPILQIRRIVVRRSSADVSLAHLLVLELGFGLWVVYGLAAAIPVLVVPNLMASMVGAVTILVTWRYRGHRRCLTNGIQPRWPARTLRLPARGLRFRAR